MLSFGEKPTKKHFFNQETVSFNIIIIIVVLHAIPCKRERSLSKREKKTHFLPLIFPSLLSTLPSFILALSSSILKRVLLREGFRKQVKRIKAGPLCGGNFSVLPYILLNTSKKYTYIYKYKT